MAIASLSQGKIAQLRYARPGWFLGRLPFKELAEKTGINADAIPFQGFDGNNETKQMGYAQYLCTKIDRGSRFESLKAVKGFAFNSHHQSLAHYRAMLREYTAIREAKGRPITHATLSNAEIQRVLVAR